MGIYTQSINLKKNDMTGYSNFSNFLEVYIIATMILIPFKSNLLINEVPKLQICQSIESSADTGQDYRISANDENDVIS